MRPPSCDRVPQHDWQFAADATLARLAVDLAIERHVGRKEPYYASGGTVFLQVGKDLTETPTLVGTGGVFTYNPYAHRILAAGVQHQERYDVLRPEAPSIVLDRNYILYSIGLLADSHPAVALQIFQDQLVAGHTVGPVPGAAAIEIPATHSHGAGHECC